MIEIELRGAPPMLLNSRLHWRSASKQKTEWYGMVLAAVGKKRPPQPYTKAAVFYTRHCGHKRPDWDNLISSFKWIQDALVYTGVLCGDQQHEIEPHYDWKPASPKEKRVSVVVVPIF